MDPPHPAPPVPSDPRPSPPGAPPPSPEQRRMTALIRRTLDRLPE
jgi:hypothetical protein